MQIQQINNTLSKGWKKTEGFKTPTATVIWLILRLVDYKFPDVLDTQTQVLILDIATAIAALGIGDKLWRWIRDKFKKQKNG
jgi:hypothetical protein